MKDSKIAPFWMPRGGIGALVFWVGLCVFLGIGTIYFYVQFSQQKSQTRDLRDQEQLLFRENQKQRNELDRLQTELLEAGSLLRNREQILRQTTESLQEVQKEKERQAALAPPDPEAPAKRLQLEAETLVKSTPVLNGVEVLREQNEVTLRVNNLHLFTPGESGVHEKGTLLLGALVPLLKEQPVTTEIQVQAHTDNTPPGAAQAAITPTNWEVSARRASAITRVLLKTGVLEPARLLPVALGDTRPLVPNDTKENKAVNRRLDLVLKVAPAVIKDGP
jgi:chemotaxis protein MotB